jgi:hypothetical protein
LTLRNLLALASAGLVSEALRRGAKRAYAGTHDAPKNVDERVTPLMPDVTSVSQIQRAVEEMDTLDVLVIKTLTRGGTYLLTVGSDNIAAPGTYELVRQ